MFPVMIGIVVKCHSAPHGLAKPKKTGECPLISNQRVYYGEGYTVQAAGIVRPSLLGSENPSIEEERLGHQWHDNCLKEQFDI